MRHGSPLSQFAIVLLAAASACAAAPTELSRFAWRQPIRGELRSGELFRVRVPSELYDGCEDDPAAELRVFGAGARPWPRIVWSEPRTQRTAPALNARILNVSTGAPFQELRVDADLSLPGRRRPPPHHAVRLELRGDEWIVPVTVLGSDDGHSWHTLAAGHILRLRQDGTIVQSDRVCYPTSDFPRLQVRIRPDPRQADPPTLDRLEVLATGPAVAEPELEELEWTPIALAVERPKWQSLTFDTGVRQTPLHRIEVEAAGEYARPVMVLTAPHPTGTWTHVTSDQIYRIRGALRSTLDLSGRGRYWRLDVFCGDDPPLSGVRVRAYRRTAWIVIEAHDGGPAALYYGAAGLPAPQHDLDRRLDAERVAVLPVRELGPREPNFLYQPGMMPRWSRRAAMLGVAWAAIGVVWVIARLLRAPPPASPDE